MSDFDLGRHETLRYHQSFYAEHALFEPGSWLHRPSPFVLRSLDHLDTSGPVVVVDVGAGVGRHTIPIAQALPAGSVVLGLDLLPSAAPLLDRNAAAASVTDRVLPVIADVSALPLAPGTVDLLIGCSALEHASDRSSFESALRIAQTSTKPGGVHCLVIGAGKREVTPDGSARPALVEFELADDDAEQLLTELYSDWEMLERSVGVVTVEEERDGEPYRLETTCHRLIARRPR